MCWYKFTHPLSIRQTLQRAGKFGFSTIRAPRIRKAALHPQTFKYNLPAIFVIFHIHVLNHQEARAPLFTSSLTTVVSSEADSIIHHQLSQRKPKPVYCWHILIQDANVKKKKKIWQCKFWNLIKSRLPLTPIPQICCCCYLEHKAVYTLIFFPPCNSFSPCWIKHNPSTLLEVVVHASRPSVSTQK